MNLLKLSFKLNNFNLYLLLFNAYFFFTYFFVFFFYVFESFKVHYHSHFIYQINFKAFSYLLISIISINFFIFVLKKFLISQPYKKYEPNKNDNYQIEILIIFIILYLFYDFIKDKNINFEINHISNIIFLFFLSIILNKYNNKKIFLFFFPILIFALFKFSSSSFVTIFFISGVLLFLSERPFRLIYFIFLSMISIILVFSVLYLNKNNKSQKGFLQDYDSYILRVSHYHIINKIFDRTPSCKDENFNKSQSDQYNQIIDYHYSDNMAFKSDFADFILSINDDKFLIYILDYEINPNSIAFKTLAKKIQLSCFSQDYLKGFYIKPFIEEKIKKQGNQKNLNFYGNKFAKKYGLLAIDDFRTGVGPTFFGDLYMNFGYTAILISSLFLLFIFYLLLNLNLPIYLPITFYIFSNFLLSLESTMIELIFNLSKLSVFIIIIFLYTHFRKKLDLFTYNFK